MSKVFVLFWILGSGWAMGSCLDFYYVKRPVTYGVVYHEYIAAWDSEIQKAQAFGLLKGSEDLETFSRVMRQEGEGYAELYFLGRGCDKEAERAVETAQTYAKWWDSFYDNSLVFYARMGITPIVGKPCRNVALEISNQLEKILH